MNRGAPPPDVIAILADVLVRNGYRPLEVLDDRLVKFLGQMPPATSLTVIKEFEQSMKSNRESIRNPVAYLMGVSKRITESVGEKIRKLSVTEPIMGPEISIRVIQRMQSLEYAGFCAFSDFTPECFELMGNMSESEGLAAVDELQCSDRSRIKTLPSFFLSILRKYQRSGASARGPFASAPGEAYATYTVTAYSSTAQLQQTLATPGLPPAPETMPMDLYYFDPSKEYAPTMPTPLDDKGLDPVLLDALLRLADQRIISFSDIDTRVVTELARVTPASALVALNEFSHIDKHTVKSVAGYLIGIIKRVGRDKGSEAPSRQEAYMHPAAQQQQGPGGGAILAIDHAFNSKMYQGLLREADFPPSLREYMRTVPEDIAILAVEELCKKDTTAVKNMSAYVKGLVRNLIEYRKN